MGPELKKTFGGETGRAVRRKKSNPGHVIVAMPNGSSYNGPPVMGINPELLAMPSFTALLEALRVEYKVRQVKKLPRESLLDAFQQVSFPTLDPQYVFATEYRTHVLVALEALGGRYDIGKLQTSVLDSYVTFVRKAIVGLIEEQVLLKSGKVVHFNEAHLWMPAFRAFLKALGQRLPEVVDHAKRQDDIRDRASARTRHAYGTSFMLFGSRVQQGMITYLACYGPSRITEICGAINAVNPKAIFPLVIEGVVCQVHDPGPGNREWRYSLNADHPTYEQLKSLLRTDVVRDMTLPPLRRPLYAGSDDLEKRHQYLPYQLFGVSWRKAAVANIFGMLLHTPNEEAEVASLARLASEHEGPTIAKAMRRWMNLGIVARRPWRGMKLYRLDETWPAYNELYALLKAMGRIWPEYAEGGAVEPALFPPRRAKQEAERHGSARERLALLRERQIKIVSAEA